MKIIAGLFLAVCLLLSSVPLSEQYGTIFADTVLPVKNDFVHFPDTTSTHIDTDVMDVGGLTLSDPGGFNVNIDIPIDIASGDKLTLIGELGFALGGPTTQLVNFTVERDLQVQSEDFFALFSRINFNINHPNDFDASIEFDSARYNTIFANDIIDIDGSGLLAVQAVNGNLDAFSPNIFGSGSNVPISGDESVSMFSRTGFIDWTAEKGIFVNGDLIDLISEQNTEMVADRDLFVHAEDLVEVTSGRHILSALGDLHFSSDRNVDFTSPSGFFINAETSISIHADSEFYLKSVEESISQVTAIGNNQVSISASDTGFLGSRDISWEIYRTQSVISNNMVMDSTSSTRIGNEETSSVNFNALTNDVSFVLDNPSGNGDEIDFIARSMTYNVANDLNFSSGAQFRASTGSAYFTIDETTSVSANDISVEGTAESGFVSSTSTGSQTFNAADDIRVDAHESTFTASTITSNSNDVDMLFNSRLTVLGDIINVAAADTTVKGGNVFFLADTIDIQPVNAAASPVMEFNSGSNMRMHVSGPYSLQGGDDVELYTSNDFQLSAEGDIVMTGSTVIDIDIDDDGFFYSHGEDLTVTSANDVEFENVIADGDDDDFMSFAFGNDITFSAPTHTINADGDLLFNAGHDINISSLDDTLIEASEVSITTISNRINSGMTFDAGDSTIFSESGADTIFSGHNVKLSAETYDFTTPLFVMRASERFDMLGKAVDIDATEIFDIASDGHVLFDAGDDIQFTTTNGPLEWTARDSINMTSAETFRTESDSVLLTADSFEFVSEDLDFSIENNLDVVAGTTTPGSKVNFFSHEDIHFLNSADVTITAPDVLFKSSGDQMINASDDITITSPRILISGQSMDTTLTGDLDISASDISFFTDEFQAFWDSATGDLSLLAQNSVYMTSDGDMLYDHPAGLLTMQADDTLLVVSDDSLAYSAGSTLLLRNVLPGESITISSGGRTAFFSDAGNVLLQSADTFNAEAGRIIMDSFSNGAVFLANEGNIQMTSKWGSVHYDANKNILLNATNTNTKASHFFTSTEGVSMSTKEGGLLFNAEGFLSDGGNAFEFLSSGNNGDIVFEAKLGGINLLVEDDIDYTAGRNMTMSSAFGAEFVPEVFMSFTAPDGQLDVNAQRGITINAGAGLDNADILFTQPFGTFEMSVADQITFHSTGEVLGDSILVSGQSDIRFQTANTGDIRFFANGLLSFDAEGSFTSTSTNNLNLESIAGSISIASVTGADFEATGGPIYFSTFSTNPGGEITITAEDGVVRFDSGNSTVLSGEQFGRFIANAGISMTSLDGSLDVLAASQNSFVRLISQGGMLVSSTGNDLNPDEGIVMDAANNIEYGTVDTETIAINSVDNVITGTFSRPVITFNAAGSVQQKGFTITSDGGILTSTEAEFISDIGGDLLIDTQLGIRSDNYGPATFTTIGTEGITLNSNAGLLRIAGDEQMSLTSNTQIVATSPGSVQFVASGKGVVDQIRFTAPDVEILSGNHQMMIGVINADVTNSFTLTTSGEGIFDGTLDQESSIDFKAGTSFSGTSGGDLFIATTNGNGPILFETQKSTSDILLETDTQSDIELLAAGELGVFGDVFSLSSSDVTFSAIHEDSNDNRSQGDIEIGAENDIVASAFEDLNISAERDLLIETTGSVDDVGAPLTMTATSEVTVTSTKDTTIRNVAGQGGELTFTALSDVVLQNSDSQGWITFDADGTFTQTSARDNELLTDSYTAEIGESYSVVTSGRDPNDDFGVRMDVEENDLTFKALFGAIRFNSATSSGAVLSQGSTTVSTDSDGLLQASQTTVNADRITLDTTRAGVELFGDSGLDFSVGSSLLMTARGVDDNSDFGIAFEAVSSAPFELVVGRSLTVSGGGAFLNAKSIELNAVEQEILFQSDNGDLRVEATESITFFGETLNIDSEKHMQLEGGSISIDGDATIVFDSNEDLVMETTGSDAAIDFFSSGKILFDSMSFNAHTERTPTSNINVIGSLARIEFTPSAVNDDGFSLDFVADHGDLTITAQGDDADIYGTGSAAFFVASNDVTFASDLNLPGLNGVDVNSVSDTFTAQGTLYLQAEDDVDIDSRNGILLHVGPDDTSGEGGTFLAQSLNDSIFIDGVDSVDIVAIQQGAEVTVSAHTGNIAFNTATVTISDRAVMKIPMNINPRESDFSGITECVNRSFFWTDRLRDDPIAGFDNSIGYLCVCVGITPQCSPFYEPPCVPGVGNCPADTRL